MHIFLTNAMLMQKSTYAKVRTIHEILKINMDNYRYYLMAKVRIFKSSGQDFTPVLFILWVHHPMSMMETLMVAPLVILMMSPSPSTPTWPVGLTQAVQVPFSQILQVVHLPPIHSTGVGSLDVKMIDVPSWSGSSSATHKQYNYLKNNVPFLQGIGSGLVQIRHR